MEYILQPDLETDGLNGLGAELHAAARTPNLLTSLHLFSQGADPNFFHEVIIKFIYYKFYTD